MLANGYYWNSTQQTPQVCLEGSLFELYLAHQMHLQRGFSWLKT
jgi:hypothetical protein